MLLTTESTVSDVDVKSMNKYSWPMPKYPDFVLSSDSNQVTPVAVVGSQLTLISVDSLAYFSPNGYW